MASFNLNSNTKRRKMASSDGFNSSIAAEQIGHSRDVLTEILRKLPPKTLLKFKLVSKHWKSLLSSPAFCHAHTRTLHANGALKPTAFFIDSPSVLAFLPLNLDNKPRFPFITDVNILQSCTGLLLCRARKYPRLWNDPVRTLYYVCNPTTKMVKVLSIPLPQSEGFTHVGVFLAFDPLKSPYYNIISIWSLTYLSTWTSKTFSVDLYSSETNSWRQTKFLFTSNSRVDHRRGVFCHGAIHWYNRNEGSVQYLNVEKECVKSMPLPELDNKFVGERVLSQCGGHLNLVVVHKNNNPFEFSVFEMVDDYSGWYFKYNLNLESKLNVAELQSSNGANYGRGFLLGPNNLVCGSHLLFYPDREKGSEFMLLPDGQVVSCSLKDLKGLKQLKYGKIQVFPYFETLFCDEKSKI